MKNPQKETDIFSGTSSEALYIKEILFSRTAQKANVVFFELYRQNENMLSDFKFSRDDSIILNPSYYSDSWIEVVMKEKYAYRHNIYTALRPILSFVLKEFSSGFWILKEAILILLDYITYIFSMVYLYAINQPKKEDIEKYSPLVKYASHEATQTSKTPNKWAVFGEHEWWTLTPFWNMATSPT